MTESDDADGAWAGNDIPVPEPPSGIIATPRRSESLAIDASDPDASPFGPLGTSQPNDDETTSRSWSARKVAVALVAAGSALVVAVLIVGGGDDPAATEDSATTTDATQETIEPTSTTNVTSTSTSTPVPSVGPRRLELPAEVAAISDPTEILMFASDGLLHTLSLPSGVVRTVPVFSEGSEDYWGQGLVVGPDAAAMVSGRGMVIVPRDSPATIELGLDEFDGESVEVVGWRSAPDGTTRFLVVSYGSQAQSGTYEVGIDGVVTVVGDDAIDLSREYSTTRTDDGKAYVNDAGGVYELSADGSAVRVDDGVLRSASSSSLMIRQCTPTLTCGDLLVDRATGDRRLIEDGIVPEDMQFSGFGLDLAPDGSAVSGIVNSVAGQELAVVDLVSGDRFAIESQSWFGGSRWAADSSGVFEPSASGSGVEFISRAAGQPVHFADELEQISSLAVRRPISELAPDSLVTTVPITFSDGAGPSATGLDVVALSRSGNVVEVDIDARTADVWSAQAAIAIRDPAMFRLDDRVALLTNVSPDGTTSGFLAVPGDQQPLPPELLGDGPILTGPSPGTVWTSATTPADSEINGVQQVLIDLRTGKAAEPSQSIGVPGGALVGGDGRGNLVISRGGDVYIAASAGDVTELRRLTSGELLAIGVDTAYVRECDDASACSVIRVDRLSDTRIALPEQLGLFGAAAIDTADPPYGLVGSGVAPGGDMLLASTGDGWLLIDAASGPFTYLEDLDGDAAFVWGVDGRSAATMIDGRFVVVGLDGVSVVDGLGSLRALAGAPVPAAD